MKKRLNKPPRLRSRPLPKRRKAPLSRRSMKKKPRGSSFRAFSRNSKRPRRKRRKKETKRRKNLARRMRKRRMSSKSLMLETVAKLRSTFGIRH